jgi:hypothetical protein
MHLTFQNRTTGKKAWAWHAKHLKEGKEGVSRQEA